MGNKIVVRVYGLLIKGDKVLLSDERLGEFKFTKFPGGGLEFGEGTHACLLREMREEMGKEFNILSHFYTTDFYQTSAFHPSHQILSVYYFIDGNEPDLSLVSNSPFDFKTDGNEIRFRWIKVSELSESDVTFPIDKLVVSMLQKKFK